jgi:hypothetical protein
LCWTGREVEQMVRSNRVADPVAFLGEATAEAVAS